MALPRKLGNRLLLGMLLGLAAYVALALISEIGQAREAFARMPWWILPAACALSFLNYVVRFWKWQRYLALLEIDVERRTSFLIYLAGLSMSVTPGKMGEVFKSWLLRKVNGTRIHKSAPIVVAERMTDLLGYLILIAIGGLASAPEFAWVFWATLALALAALLLIGSPRVGGFLVAIARRGPAAEKIAHRLEGALASTRVLLAPRELALPTLVSCIGWGLECTGFWLIANALVPGSVPYLFAIFAFALSAVAGAIAVIAPGGLGITEGLLGKLLRPKFQPVVERTFQLVGDAALQKAVALAACAIILARLCTLWFAVTVGLIASAIFTRRFGAVDESALDDEA